MVTVIVAADAPSWVQLAINVAASKSGAQKVDIKVDNKESKLLREIHPSATVAMKLESGTALWNLEAILGYILGSSGSGNNQHWLGWFRSNVNKGVEKFILAGSQHLSKSKFLNGDACGSADVLLAAWVSSSSDLPKAVAGWSASVIGDATVVASKSSSSKKKAAKKGPIIRPEAGKFYITTAINYTNGNPHVGHAYEAVTSDVVARYHRQYGREVFFMTGTDEHGKKIAQTAEKEGVQPIDICDRYANKFQVLNKLLNISNDFFIRTTMPVHKENAQKLWQKCKDNGDIYLDTYEGWYNIKEEEFVTDSNAEEMGFKDGKGDPLERMKEESYFFRMSKYEKQLKDHIEANPSFIEPAARRQDVLQRLNKEPLGDQSVSRATFSWGIPVPGDTKHVMYVWFDALTNYISGVDGLGNSKNSKFWPADLHIVGKDITWFHCVIWPTMLMSAGVALPKRVYAHGFVQDRQGKRMSKSIGNVVDPYLVLERYSSDLVRYFLIKQAHYGSDLKFSEPNVIAANNADLADTLGNLVHRVTNLTKKFCDGVVPNVPAESIVFDVDELIMDTEKKFASLELTSSVVAVIENIKKMNDYVTKTAPFSLKGDENKAKRQAICRTILEGLYVCAHFFVPTIPMTAALIFEKLGTPPMPIAKLSANFDNLKPGTAITVGKILFDKIDPIAPEAELGYVPEVESSVTVDSAEAKAMLAQIAAQGLKVKEAKATKDPKAQDEIDALLVLKKQYNDKTGEDIPGAKKPSKAKGKKEAKKESKPVEAKASSNVDAAKKQEMLDTIAKQGLVVRDLKAIDGDAAADIQKLLALKKEYKEVTGEDVPGAKKSSKKKK